MKEFELIDRINLYFKLGIHDVTCIVPFTTEEQPYVEKVRTASNFDEVLKVSLEIYEFMKSKQKLDAPISPPIDESADPSPVDTVEPENNEENSSETTDTPVDKADNEIDDPMDGEQEIDIQEEEFEVKTQESFSSRQSEIISKDKWEYVLPPTIDWENHITSNDEFVEDMKEFEQTIRKINPPYGDNLVNNILSDLKRYKKESVKSVSFLVKEFEMKKSAKEYNRTFVSKTGILDTNKIHSYKWNEDLFKKSNVVPTGKNHGLLMFVDWSGSMSSNIDSTIKQLFNLVQFCDKVKIPFEVYSFVENRSEFNVRQTDGCKDEISISSGYRLIQLFTSDRKAAKLDVQLETCWLLVSFLIRNYFSYGTVEDHMRKYEMGSTPLNETIFAAIYLFKKFCKNNAVEKVNTVFLTDGESNQLTCNTERTNSLTGETYIVRRPLYRMYNTCISFRDPKSGYQHHKLWDPSKLENDSWSSVSINLTAKLLHYYRWMTNCNVIGYRLSSEMPSAILKASDRPYDEFRKIWKKNNYVIEKNLGYSELYAVKVNRDFGGETQEMNANSNSTQSKLRNEFRKHVQSKSFNKIILSKFVDQIA
jgi:hypothetical protein